jgi:hypothetical protein
LWCLWRWSRHTGFWWKNIKERIHLDDIGLDGRTLLEWILDKQHEMVYNGLICFRIRAGVGLMWTGSWTFGFHKLQRISCLAEELLASGEGLCSMESVFGKEQFL